ncbi:MAG: ATP-binding protein [Acidobacteria bacterium]|nr:ATP-binding protein [Acidobacteriota bacterium]
MPQSVPERITPEELLQLALFADESLEAVEWIASQMGVRRFEAADVFVREGDPVTEFQVILEGEIHFRRDGDPSANVFVVVSGQAIGVLPFSRMKTWGARGWAVQATKIGAMDVSHLRELVYRAPTLAQRLVSEMTDRTRTFTRMEESSNRLLALGRLAAGLAHELNNPASAAVRSSARLREVLTERYKYVMALRGEVLPERAREIMSDLTQAITECLTTPAGMDALERADLESDLADWLETVGVPCELSAGLVDARVTVAQVRPLALLVSREILALGLRILVADHEIFCLTRELEEASRRISDLVQAVKTYSYMDQSPVAEVDVEQGIDVTLRMFQHQLKHRVHVTRQFDQNLPRIRADGSALNQIWTNLIDNALDAMESLPPEQPKELHVKTCVEREGILVEITDNGPGIPTEVQNRMFEPFFTTKPVGDGTGLGLDIVRRIIRNHKGSIRVESNPGRTMFQVRLPFS